MKNKIDKFIKEMSDEEPDFSIKDFIIELLARCLAISEFTSENPTDFESLNKNIKNKMAYWKKVFK